MILAELEIYHSRPIAPTRRIALGDCSLPTEPPPGAGGLLLAAVVAATAEAIPADLREDLVLLIEDLDSRRRVAQPRVRHRFQTDRIGLLRSTHRLVAEGESIRFDFDDDLGVAVQQALGAIYACAGFPPEARALTFDAIRSSLLWIGDVDDRYVSHILGGGRATVAELAAWNNPRAWAIGVLGLDDLDPAEITKRIVQRRFRSLLRDAHPDHGGLTDEAAARIADLTEARKILSG
ncbi:MAG: hypothetical protein ACRBI6_01640 [Acidimicrobiales bacterium]